MARRLDSNDGRYTHDQVAAVVRSRVAGRPKVRFTVQDLNGNIKPIDLQVTAARITFDRERRIHRALELTFEPHPDMLRVPFVRLIHVEVGFWPMPDSGTAWLPYGTYVWTAPKRTIQQIRRWPDGTSYNVESWSVICPDLNYFLSLSGPGLSSFSVSQNSLYSEGVLKMLDRVWITDVDAVESSDEIAGEQLSWTIKAGPRATKTLTSAQLASALKAWNALVKQLAAARKHKTWKVAPDPPKPTKTRTRDLENRSRKWIDVAEVLHELLGYYPPHRNLDDEYVARPAADPSVIAPTITYVADRDSIIVPDPEVEPDLVGVANVLYVIAREKKNINPATVVGVANMDVLFPNHPLAPSKCGVTIEDYIEPTTAMSQGGADALARSELISSMLGWETIRVEIATINPEHDSFEYPSLQVPNDAEFATAQVTVEQAHDVDLIGGSMTLDLARTYRDVISTSTLV